MIEDVCFIFRQLRYKISDQEMQILSFGFCISRSGCTILNFGFSIHSLGFQIPRFALLILSCEFWIHYLDSRFIALDSGFLAFLASFVVLDYRFGYLHTLNVVNVCYYVQISNDINRSQSIL